MTKVCKVQAHIFRLNLNYYVYVAERKMIKMITYTVVYWTILENEIIGKRIRLLGCVR